MCDGHVPYSAIPILGESSEPVVSNGHRLHDREARWKLETELRLAAPSSCLKGSASADFQRMMQAPKVHGVRQGLCNTRHCYCSEIHTRSILTCLLRAIHYYCRTNPLYRTLSETRNHPEIKAELQYYYW